MRKHALKVAYAPVGLCLLWSGRPKRLNVYTAHGAPPVYDIHRTTSTAENQT